MSGTRRVGVVVLDHGRPADAERAAASARDSEVGPRVLVVENGSARAAAGAGDRLCLVENRGFGGGMNAGVEQLRREGCDRFLLLNNDAVIEPGCLRRLAEALDDPGYAAVGPVILSGSGAVESHGLSVDLRSGRVRLVDHGRAPQDRGGVGVAEALSGAVIMLSLGAIERVGLLDPEYFFGFEDVDWCLRARRAGFRLGVVEGARARHAGSATLGRGSSDRLYYATRNHVRCVESHRPLSALAHGLRRGVVLGLNLAFALRQSDVPRGAALRAVRDGFRDAGRGRFGPRAWARAGTGDPGSWLRPGE